MFLAPFLNWRGYSENPHKRTQGLGLKVILFLFIGCFLQNQSESALEVFLKLILEI